MEDQTITESAPVEDGAQALPNDAGQQTAATENQAETDGAQALPEVDDELSNFAASHGLELDSPSAIKAAKLARENQQGFHAQRHQEKLESIGEGASAGTDNQLVNQLYQDLAGLRASVQADKFRSSTKITPDKETALLGWLNDNPVKKQLVQGGHLSLQDAYTLSGLGASDSSAIKSQGAQEALQSLASKQMAMGVRGNAVNPAPTSPKTDPGQHFKKALLE